MASDTDHIIIKQEKRTGRIILNRPEALNALSPEMCIAFMEKLEAWADDETIDKLLITSSHDRAFCVGGDIRRAVSLVGSDNVFGRDFFAIEYALDMSIAAFPKPIVALADGLILGGGAGILFNASHPLVTEGASFAMPETAIGLFPDVGASFFLRRAAKEFRVFLALTGTRLGVSDMIAAGFIPQCTDASGIDEMIENLIEVPTDRLDDLIKSAAVEPGKGHYTKHLDWIERHFSAPSVEAIRDSLISSGHELAKPAYEALTTRCPLSLKVAHRLLVDDQIKPHDAISALWVDYAAAMRIMRYGDFAEGVRALLIDKDNAPNWHHSSLEAVSDKELDAIFAPLDRPHFPLPPLVEKYTEKGQTNAS